MLEQNGMSIGALSGKIPGPFPSINQQMIHVWSPDGVFVLIAPDLSDDLLSYVYNSMHLNTVINKEQQIAALAH